MNEAKLKGKMAEYDMPGTVLANELGMTAQTFYRKMRSGKFTIPEAESIIRALHITDPFVICEIFFNFRVT